MPLSTSYRKRKQTNIFNLPSRFGFKKTQISRPRTKSYSKSLVKLKFRYLFALDVPAELLYALDLFWLENALPEHLFLHNSHSFCSPPESNLFRNTHQVGPTVSWLRRLFSKCKCPPINTPTLWILIFERVHNIVYNGFQNEWIVLVAELDVIFHKWIGTDISNARKIIIQFI